jgi:hypothetical protein
MARAVLAAPRPADFLRARADGQAAEPRRCDLRPGARIARSLHGGPEVGSVGAPVHEHAEPMIAARKAGERGVTSPLVGARLHPLAQAHGPTAPGSALEDLQAHLG